MQRQIVITFEDDKWNSRGEPAAGDLFDYLVNEFDNHGVAVNLRELPDNDTLVDTYATAWGEAFTGDPENRFEKLLPYNKHERSWMAAGLCAVLGRTA